MKGTCQRCGKEVKSVPGCVVQTVECDKQRHQPVLYGDESEGWITQGRRPLPKCYDCGVEIGKPHHKGCIEEICPHCHHKAHNCGCAMKLVPPKT